MFVIFYECVLRPAFLTASLTKKVSGKVHLILSNQNFNSSSLHSFSVFYGEKAKAKEGHNQFLQAWNLPLTFLYTALSAVHVSELTKVDGLNNTVSRTSVAP